MIWQNPWAWLGLIALAVPVLIHLLGRRNARIQRFPTLRFIERSTLLSVRRTRLSDLLLMTLRMTILGAAVAALARPLLLTAGRERELGRSLARAIIVDTSASMRRAVASPTPGERAIDAARRDAERLAREAETSVVPETASPRDVLRGAVAWLETQPARREIIVLSDFQPHTVDSSALAAVPLGIGITLTRAAADSTSAPGYAPSNAADAPVVEIRPYGSETRIVARATLLPARTGVEWREGSRASGEQAGLTILASPTERSRAQTARDVGAELSAAPAVPGTHPVVIIHPGHDQRSALARDATVLDESWQGDVVLRLRRDSTLAAAAAAVDLPPELDATFEDAKFTVVARTADGRPAILAASGDAPAANASRSEPGGSGEAATPAPGASTPASRRALLLFSTVDPGSVASAALVAAVMRASTPPVAAAEFDPSTHPDELLRSWQREPAPIRALDGAIDSGTSDGRWLWLVALLLLGVENWLRRSKRARAAHEEVHERAA